MSEPVLRIEKVEKYYGSAFSLTKALNGISLSVGKGEFVAIMGPSGSGKTTLLNCISTIDRVSSGNIFVDGHNVTRLRGHRLNAFRRQELGFIFQDFNLLDTMTAYENIALALQIQHVSSRSIEEAVREMARETRLSKKALVYPVFIREGRGIRDTAGTYSSRQKATALVGF